MCDQTEVQYLPGEVVWVKLRALWWPGLVQDYDLLPDDVTSGLRKRPIAIVKFFQEDSYEYVHKLDLIYHYNCSRKHEFIKKGIDFCRKKSADKPSSMDSFPADIVTAEELTHGDRIFSKMKLSNQKKSLHINLSLVARKEIWEEKGKEDSPLKDKVARRKKLTSKLQAMGWLSRGITANIVYPSPDVPRIITHRRFLNKVRNPDAKSDYEVRILEQKCEDEPSSEPDKTYQCVLCGYVTRRLNVIVIHFNTTHSRKSSNSCTLIGSALRSPLLKVKGEIRKSESGKSSLPGRKRMSIKGKIDIKVKNDDIKVESFDSENTKLQPIKKEKGKPGRKRKVKIEDVDQDVKQEVVKKPKVLDSLLADWEEDAEQDREDDEDKPSPNNESNDLFDGDSFGDCESTGVEKSTVSEATSASKSKEVFEFDPDEDDNIEFNLTPNIKGFSRRIPRVIESSKEKNLESSDSKKTPKEKSLKSPKPKEEDEKKEESIDDFESLLAETSVPSLPSVPISSNFSLDVVEEPNPKPDEPSDDSGTKAILKEQNESEKVKIGSKRSDRAKNSESDCSNNSKTLSLGRKEPNTAKVTVEVVPELSVASNDIDDVVPLSNNDAFKNDSKPGQSTGGGDHTYVSGSTGRKRRRSLLPLDKNEGGLDIMSMPVVLGTDFAVDEPSRVNKQPFLPKLAGSDVVCTPPRKRGRPPKRGGRGSRVVKSSLSSTKSPPSLQAKSPPPHLGSKSPSHLGSKSPSPHFGSKSPPPSQSMKSPVRRAGSMSPPAYIGPKSPLCDSTPKSPDRTPKSPPHHRSPKSPKSKALQDPKSPIGTAMSPDRLQGHKSPLPHQSPRSPRSPHQSPTHQGPKSPQSLHSPKSPLMTVVSAASPKSPKTSTASVSDVKSPKSPSGSLVKIAPGDFTSTLSGLQSPSKSPQASATQGVLLSPAKISSGKVLTTVSSLSKASTPTKKASTSGAVVVQSQPDLQPEACGIGKIMSSPSSVACSSSGTVSTSGNVKTIKVAVPSTPCSSPMVVGKVGTPGTQTRKVMIVQGKGGTQRMILPTEASQQILSNIGSGKKIIVMTKGSGGSPKLVLTSQQQKLLASGGKVTTSSGQVVTSKGAVLSSVAKLVASKQSTSGATTGLELSSEPPALVKTEGKKTYKIISSTPQSKGNILLNTSSGQILVPVSSIASGSGVNTPSSSKFILPAGAKNMKLLNAVTGSGQKVILQMKSSPAKASLPSTPKAVQPIVPKTVQSISPKTSQPISPKIVQSITSKTVQPITPKTVQPITAKTGQSLTPKAGQPLKVTTIATMVQPVPQLTPISSPNKAGRPKQIKPAAAKPTKTPAQAKLSRKSGVASKPMVPALVTTSSSLTSVVLPATSPPKRTSGIVPNPNLKPIVSLGKQTKKVSLAAKPAPAETQTVAPIPQVQVAMPALDQIQTTLVPSVESSSAVTLPSSTQQLIAVPTEDGGQVMYLIDNSTLIGLEGSNQANLGNVILTFDNMGQPSVSNATSDFTFQAPSSGQDILAEALANTQVLQSEGTGGDLSLDTSGLLSSHASSAMYPPTLSHGVLETSLTLNQPIMTPLEDLSAVSSLQPPPASGTVSVDLPSTITVPDITISTSSYSSLPIPSATIQSTVFSDAQSISTFSSSTSGDAGVFIETGSAEGESFLTTDSVYEQSGEGASMPLLDG